MKLLSSFGDSNYAERAIRVRELLSFLESIKGSTGEVFFYLLEHGAATAWVLEVDAGLPEATVYRAIKRLRKLDIIVPGAIIPKIRGKLGGPRPTVWALAGSSTEEVARAMIKHTRAISPKYKVAEEMVQALLEDTPGIYERNEVTHRELINYLKIKRAPFKRNDVAELMATILLERGIKVWR